MKAVEAVSLDKEFLELLHQGAAMLRSEGAQAVYLFGSQAAGTARESSDVDIAISGLPPRRFFDAMAKLAALFQRPVDLIDLDEDSPFTSYLKAKEGLLQRVA